MRNRETGWEGQDWRREETNDLVISLDITALANGELGNELFWLPTSNL